MHLGCPLQIAYLRIERLSEDGLKRPSIHPAKVRVSPTGEHELLAHCAARLRTGIRNVAPPLRPCESIARLSQF